MAEPFIGEIRIFPYSFAPRNWAYCDGQEVDIQQNVMLYTVLGLEYGGNGDTTFGLPNLKGRVPMHHGRGPGLYSKWIGEMGGYEALPLLESQIPPHTHAIKATSASANQSNPGGNTAGSGSMNVFSGGSANTNCTGMVDNAGSSFPHENRQPFMVFGFCIAMDGLYPARS